MNEPGADERWTQDAVRAFALSLPEAHEDSPMGRPDLRVRKRIFARSTSMRRDVVSVMAPSSQPDRGDAASGHVAS